ncbi:hypothetical protein ACHAXH_004562, partial [Discostella pseudostelligera]
MAKANTKRQMMTMVISSSQLLCLVLVASIRQLQLQSASSFSLTTPPSSPTPPPSSSSPSPSSLEANSCTAKCDFQSFEFDPSTGICRRPASFQYIDEMDGEDDQYFVLRNVPGNGDCVFNAVLSSVFISMGMLNPDSDFLNPMSSMAIEMRNVVANYLSSPDGTLYVNDKPRKRIVRCQDLLRTAAKSEGLTTEEYLCKLRLPGRQGGLYGGGPELTVLSNILRRPISIYHLKQKHSMDENNNYCEIQRMGVFGEGLFEDPAQTIPDSVISNAVFFTLDGRSKEQRQSTS